MKLLHQQLQSFGLNQNEIALYLAALEIGECSIGPLEKRTNLHRQLIYNAADSLSSLGLMKVARKGGKRRFEAAQPSVFEEIAFNRYQEAKLLADNLEDTKKKAGFSGEAKIFAGRDEVQDYYYSSITRQPIRSRVDILGVESKRFFEIFQKDQNPYIKFERERVARKVKWRVILFARPGDEALQNHGREYLECRVLKERIVAPMDIMVWRDHVGFLIYGAEPTVMDIPGEASAKGFRKYLSVLWSQGTDVRSQL